MKQGFCLKFRVDYRGIIMSGTLINKLQHVDAIRNFLLPQNEIVNNEIVAEIRTFFSS